MDGEMAILESRLEIVTRERRAAETTARDVIAYLNRDEGQRALTFPTIQAAATDAIACDQKRRSMHKRRAVELLVAIVLAATLYVTLHEVAQHWFEVPSYYVE